MIGVITRKEAKLVNDIIKSKRANLNYKDRIEIKIERRSDYKNEPKEMITITFYEKELGYSNSLCYERNAIEERYTDILGFVFLKKKYRPKKMEK